MSCVLGPRTKAAVERLGRNLRTLARKQEEVSREDWSDDVMRRTRIDLTEHALRRARKHLDLLLLDGGVA